MAESSVSYRCSGGIATIAIDDGKRNALTQQVLSDLHAAFDRAASDEAIVILTGREDVLSAGFDLKALRGGGTRAIRMLKAGYTLPARVLAHPFPVVVACNGHALAMGVFMMLAADYVIGTAGDYKISANEVAIGLPLPRVAAAIMRHRLRPADFQRATTLAEYFDVEAARAAGFFDEVVDAARLAERAREKAEALAELDMSAHRITKERVRSETLRRLRTGAPLDLKDAVVIGARAALKSRAG